MSRDTRFTRDSRAVSVTITHVLTIAITTILISGLLIGTGTLLDSQKDRATFDEKSTIGDRLATEITSVSQSAERHPDDEVVVRTEHPRRLSGGQYFVHLYDDPDECETWGHEQCLVLESGQTDSNVEVPFKLDGTDIDGTTVQGGDIWIHYDGDTVTLKEERPT